VTDDGRFPPRPPAVAAGGMAATSHPLATHAALRALEDGGSAVDAAVTAAAVLCVCEPMSTGIGGDAFALVWEQGRLSGLNASGRAPASADPERFAEVPESGPCSVTVPGAVSGWAALVERHGRLGLDRVLAPAIAAAEQGFAVTPVIAGAWARHAARLVDPEARGLLTPAPRVGQLVRAPQLARTLRAIAADGPAAFYDGEVARAICAASWLEEEDLAAQRAEWVEPLRLRYGGLEVCELPPNGQGAAALQALGIADGLAAGDADPLDRVHLQAEAMKLAFADAGRYIADEPLPHGYLDPAYLAERRALVRRDRAGRPGAGALPRGGTVYLCVVDGERRACSLIQSLYEGFGSGVAAPGTGIVLQNRGACFTLERGHPNRLAPGRRPYHTIIPGMLLRDGGLVGPFGLMGGHMQPQGHLQLVQALHDRGLDPQAALDAPRWRLDAGASGWRLALERPLWPLAPALRARGHDVVEDAEAEGFGGGQAIVIDGDALVGGSGPRKDGAAAGF
jgi:gamma-glutamyltranspeptidase/glutathione hydrolase